VAIAPQHKPTLGQIIAYFKYQSTKEINNVDNTGTITKLWQRNYYEHIIRNERDLERIREYITNNPANWASDENNPMKM
jgi:REP element-mobilizing transposase RayT